MNKAMSSQLFDNPVLRLGQSMRRKKQGTVLLLIPFLHVVASLVLAFVYANLPVSSAAPSYAVALQICTILELGLISFLIVCVGQNPIPLSKHSLSYEQLVISGLDPVTWLTGMLLDSIGEFCFYLMIYSPFLLLNSMLGACSLFQAVLTALILLVFHVYMTLGFIALSRFLNTVTLWVLATIILVPVLIIMLFIEEPMTFSSEQLTLFACSPVLPLAEQLTFSFPAAACLTEKYCTVFGIPMSFTSTYLVLNAIQIPVIISYCLIGMRYPAVCFLGLNIYLSGQSVSRTINEKGAKGRKMLRDELFREHHLFQENMSPGFRDQESLLRPALAGFVFFLTNLLLFLAFLSGNEFEVCSVLLMLLLMTSALSIGGDCCFPASIYADVCRGSSMSEFKGAVAVLVLKLLLLYGMTAVTVHVFRGTGERELISLSSYLYIMVFFVTVVLMAIGGFLGAVFMSGFMARGFFLASAFLWLGVAPMIVFIIYESLIRAPFVKSLVSISPIMVIAILIDNGDGSTKFQESLVVFIVSATALAFVLATAMLVRQSIAVKSQDDDAREQGKGD